MVANDEVTENITYEPETETPMVKICECGAENPPAARKCSACDEDISDILPAPKAECCCKQYSLCEISGAYTYDVPNDTEIILGRETVLKECYTCPFCGEERLFNGENYGIT